MAKLSKEELICALEEPDLKQDFNDSQDDPDHVVESDEF
jgi:hypothetical protein